MGPLFRANCAVLGIGLVDPLWCLWDENRQCLHDKVSDTIVINDLSPDQANWPPQALPWSPQPPSPQFWPTADGSHEMLTSLQGTLYLKNLGSNSAAVRLAIRQLVAFSQGIGASTAS